MAKMILLAQWDTEHTEKWEERKRIRKGHKEKLFDINSKNKQETIIEQSKKNKTM